MSLTKEDGSVVTGANSYADAADSIAYQTDRGRQAWIDATTEVQEAALVRATDYIETRFGRRFIGSPVGDVQELAWPRTGARYPRTGNAFPDDEVPEDILNATILYADQVIGPGDDLEAMTELAITPELDATGRTVIAKREKVDVLEEATTYSSGPTLRTIQPIPEADRLIRSWQRLGTSSLTLRAG